MHQKKIRNSPKSIEVSAIPKNPKLITNKTQMSQSIHSPPCTISLNTILMQFVQVYEWGIINTFNHQLDFIAVNFPLTLIFIMGGGHIHPPYSPI